jgi:preprotein translocase subunit SecF
LKYAMGAIIALIHDVAITVGAFALTDREISLSIIAAFLTIVGYSLNDTIVVFDRIRENLSRFRRRGFEEVMNASINETLSRTILTSTTTLIVVVALFVLGGGVIHDFAFALLIGVVVGTYSSVFVASPILLVFQGRFSEKPKVKKGSR